MDVDEPKPPKKKSGSKAKQAIAPLNVEAITAQVDASGVTRARGIGERLSQNELALFTRQLASLLEAGLPLEQAFTALLEQAERAYMRDLIASIRSEVIGGSPFSTALSHHPRDFAEIYRALVASGEQIGQRRLAGARQPGDRDDDRRAHCESSSRLLPVSRSTDSTRRA